jgi:hypothetical protein
MSCEWMPSHSGWLRHRERMDQGVLEKRLESHAVSSSSHLCKSQLWSLCLPSSYQWKCYYPRRLKIIALIFCIALYSLQNILPPCLILTTDRWRSCYYIPLYQEAEILEINNNWLAQGQKAVLQIV